MRMKAKLIIVSLLALVLACCANPTSEKSFSVQGTWKSGSYDEGTKYHQLVCTDTSFEYCSRYSSDGSLNWDYRGSYTLTGTSYSATCTQKYDGGVWGAYSYSTTGDITIVNDNLVIVDNETYTRQ